MKKPCLATIIGFFISPLLFAEHLTVPKQGAYEGAYIEGGDTEDDITYDKILAFEKLAGKPQAIIGFSNFWGKEEFPAEQVAAIRKYGAVPLIYWNPWGPPYLQTKPQPKYALSEILAGKFDAYIRNWSSQAAKTKAPLLVSWGLEMNGNWFPWCGPCQGIKGKNANLFVPAYRHVVDLARKEGAANIEWVFHANNFSYPDADWNKMAKYYPGDDDVDWLGMSAYGMQFPALNGAKWRHFNDTVRLPYPELCKLNSTKPIILAEWGVGEFPREGSKAEFFEEAFSIMKTRYPRIKAAVYWHERWENPNEIWSNLRINSSPHSLEAYRKGLQDPYWLARPFLGR